MDAGDLASIISKRPATASQTGGVLNEGIAPVGANDILDLGSRLINVCD